MEAIIPDLSYIIELMKNKSGIIFTPNKSYVILTKLQPLLTKYNLANIDELLVALKQQNNLKLVTDIVETLTINETSFYRDRYPFEALDKFIIPEILKDDPAKLNLKILCAACSTGQEPYSLVMHFLEHKQQYKLNCHITAIDLASHAIEKAKSGVYNQFEVQRGLPITSLVKYFTQMEKDWIISDKVKQQVNFRQFNLMDDLSILGKFDIIFCRNVLIYFDEKRRNQVIENLQKVMAPQATLILGGTEAIPYENKLLHKITEYNGIYTN